MENVGTAVPLTHRRRFPDRGSLMSKTNQKVDLARLRARIGEKPRTKIGQVRQAWPEIEALFDAGHSLGDVWIWMKEVGVDITYKRLSHCVCQIRRGEPAKVKQPPQPMREPVENSQHGGSAAKADPLANVRTREQKRDGFQFNSEPDSKKLI